MVYANLNEKALAFGESHMRQVRGRVKSLTAEWEDKKTNGVVLHGGKVASRYTGMSLDERRAAKLDELRFEIDELESSLWSLEYHVNGLRYQVEEEAVLREKDEVFWQWQCQYHRKKIAKYTGTNPASFVGETVELKYDRG